MKPLTVGEITIRIQMHTDNYDAKSGSEMAEVGESIGMILRRIESTAQDEVADYEDVFVQITKLGHTT